MTILWLVAPQIDYGNGGAMEVPGADTLWQEWLTLAKDYDQLWLSLESHPADHLSFAGMHMWSKPGQVINLPNGEMKLCIMHCVSESFGALLQPVFNALTFDQMNHFGGDKLQEPEFFFSDNQITNLKKLAPKYIHVVGVNHTEIIPNSCSQMKAQGLPVGLHYELSHWPDKTNDGIQDICL